MQSYIIKFPTGDDADPLYFSVVWAAKTSQIKSAFDSTKNRYFKKAGTSVITKQHELSQLLERPVCPAKVICWEMSPGVWLWCDAVISGWFSLFQGWGRGKNIKLIFIRSSGTDSPSDHRFMYFDGERNERRLGSVEYESGWQFESVGTPQWFENIAYYNARRVRDRMNRDILVEYLNKLGVNVRDSSIWKPRTPCLVFPALNQLQE